MKSFYLVETATRDKLIHQGIFFQPRKAGKPTYAKASAGRRALLWVHGLTDTFYGDANLHSEFANACEKVGFGYAAFNNRGHDLVASTRKVDKQKPKGYTHANVGSAYEKFSDCVYDIEAGIDFLVGEGFQEVVLIGHSTGANKICYYAGSRRHPSVVGFVLASPLSDRLDSAIDKTKLHADLQHMEKLIQEKKGDELVIGYHFFPLTPKRFISLFKPNSLEDQFDYGDPQPKMTFFSKIKKPLLVIVGDKDEYLDRPVKQVMKVFDEHQHSTNYQSVIIKDALHSFNGKEKEVVHTIASWVNKLT